MLELCLVDIDCTGNEFPGGRDTLDMDPPFAFSCATRIAREFEIFHQILF